MAHLAGGQYSPAEWLGIWKALGANKADSWLGSYNLVYESKKVYCCYGTATIKFNVWDWYNLESMTAIPPMCWQPPRQSWLRQIADPISRIKFGLETRNWLPGFLLPENTIGGPFAGKNHLFFLWEEELSFKGDHRCESQ